jgi:hypothetical protein
MFVYCLHCVLMLGTELDENGNVSVGMQAFKKMELCTMVSCLHMRMLINSMDYSLEIYGNWKSVLKPFRLPF